MSEIDLEEGSACGLSEVSSARLELIKAMGNRDNQESLRWLEVLLNKESRPFLSQLEVQSYEKMRSEIEAELAETKEEKYD